MTAIATSGAQDIGSLARSALVDSQLRTNDVVDPVLVAAVRAVPREKFLPPSLHAAAYIDRALPMGNGRWLNPVLTTARLIDAIEAEPGTHILVIGAATGYAAALLAHCGMRITAVESDATMLELAGTALADMSGVSLVANHLHEGAPNTAPYDALIVDGAIEALPHALRAQLVPGAPISTGVIDGTVTRLARATAVDGPQPIRPMPFADLECVALPGFAPPPRFTF